MTAHDMEDFVVITGISGAGKSQAMATFEDAGYFCVDNLPPEMIRSLAELFGHEGSKVERAAVASDVRGGDYFDTLVQVLDDLDSAGLPYRILYLEADDPVLINRFKETRRRHPLANGGSVEAALARERALLGPLKERADVSIDTSDLSAARLRKVVADKMLPHGRPGRLAVTFMTFGFKHGTPRDADLTFDVRFLPNPHYEAEPARADGPRPRRHPLRRELRRHRRVLRASDAAAGLPAAELRAGGEGPPDGGDRLHGRPPPLGRDSRAPGAGIRGEGRLHGGGGPPRRGKASTPPLAGR